MILELLTAINIYRAESNLKPLIVDYKLEQVAEKRAYELIGLKEFNHNGFKKSVSHFWFRDLGENLSKNYEEADALTAWKKSEGHNKNLLNKKFDRAGLIKKDNMIVLILSS